MRLKLLVVAAMAAFGVSAAQATMTNTYTEFTVVYDETTLFGSPSSSFSSGGGLRGCGWDVPVAVNVFSVGGVPAMMPFTLPSFTITANPGWTLSGPFTAYLGQPVFNEVGAGATTSITAGASLSFDGGGPGPIPPTAVGKIFSPTPPGVSAGYFESTLALPHGTFTMVSLSAGTLTLAASGGFYASIQATPQNKLNFSVIATPVPEPETAALWLAGLLAVGMIAKRRSRG